MVTGPAFLVCLAVLSLGSCSTYDPLANEVKQLQALTMPPGGAAREVAALSRDRASKSAQAIWEIDTAMGWPDYRAWVMGRVPSYRLTQIDGDTLVFSREAEGDFFRLTLGRRALAEGQRQLVVQASFRAVAF